MITYQEETYTLLFTPEFMDMYRSHWREIGSFDKTKIPLAVNWDMYKALGKANTLVVFSAKDDDLLIGYNLFILAPHPHYRNNKIAENDILYLDPEYRRGFTGYKFIKYCVEELKKKADIIYLNMKVANSYGSIAKRLGFKPLDIKYSLEV